MRYEYRPGTPVEATDIRVGDRVRCIHVGRELDRPDGVSVREFTATDNDVSLLVHFAGDGEWELIERPKPELKAGQIWRRDDGIQMQTIWEDNSVVVFVDQEGYLRGQSYWEREGHRLTYVGEAEIGVKP